MRDESVTASGGTLRFCLLGKRFTFGGRHGIYGDANGTFGDSGSLRDDVARRSRNRRTFVWPERFDVIHAHDWRTRARRSTPELIRWATHRRAAFARRHGPHNLLTFQGVCGFEAVDRLEFRRAFRQHVLAQTDLREFAQGRCRRARRCRHDGEPNLHANQRHGPGFFSNGSTYAQLVGIANRSTKNASIRAASPASRRATTQTCRTERNGRANKRSSLQRMDLDFPDAPLFACVS